MSGSSSCRCRPSESVGRIAATVDWARGSGLWQGCLRWWATSGAGRGGAAEARCATDAGRGEHRQARDAAIGAWTAGWEKVALMRELMERRAPAGAVYSAPEYLGDAHLEARAYFADLRHPDTGR